jgi:hypothetical protein
VSPAPTGDKPTAAATAELLPYNHRPHHDTRVDLAQRTFPGLEAHARKFRRWRDGLAGFTLFWLFLTALGYWDAGLGRAALERLDQNWKTYVAELRDSPSLMECRSDFILQPPTPGADPKAIEAAERQAFACNRHVYLRFMGNAAVEEVREVFRCEGMWSSRLVHVWCWHWLLSGSAAGADGSKAGQTAAGASGQTKTDQQVAAERKKNLEDNATYWQMATSMLSVFTIYVLPIMFALLGTLIGAFRAILNRIGASELAPRDLVRMKIGIPTGLVAGIAVGLFLSPSSVPVQGAGGVASQLTLTASALGFLAGYASSSFFGFLDNVIRSVFPYGSPAASPPATETRA